MGSMGIHRMNTRLSKYCYVILLPVVVALVFLAQMSKILIGAVLAPKFEWTCSILKLLSKIYNWPTGTPICNFLNGINSDDVPF